MKRLNKMEGWIIPWKGLSMEWIGFLEKNQLSAWRKMKLSHLFHHFYAKKCLFCLRAKIELLLMLTQSVLLVLRNFAYSNGRLQRSVFIYFVRFSLSWLLQLLLYDYFRQIWWCSMTGLWDWWIKEEWLYPGRCHLLGRVRRI